MKTNPKVILTCRTCLEMNKTYVNMFKHHEREKLLSELLRECVPIQVFINLVSVTYLYIYCHLG